MALPKGYIMEPCPNCGTNPHKPGWEQEYPESWNVIKGQVEIDINEERKKRAERYIDTHGHLMMWDLLVSFAESETSRLTAASRWHSIAEEGLPNQSREYLFYEKEMGFVAQYFHPIAASKVSWATHYQKIEPPEIGREEK